MAYSTYFGGSKADEGAGIAVDARGNAYVTGFTHSSDFPLAHPLSTNSVLRGEANAFVSKLSFDARTATLSFAYSTYLGGSNIDEGVGIAVDARGDAYVTGVTSSLDFPLAHPLPTNSVLRGVDDAFVVESEHCSSRTRIAMPTRVTMPTRIVKLGTQAQARKARLSRKPCERKPIGLMPTPGNRGFGNIRKKSPVKPLAQPRKRRLRIGSRVSCNEVTVILEISYLSILLRHWNPY